MTNRSSDFNSFYVAAVYVQGPKIPPSPPFPLQFPHPTPTSRGTRQIEASWPCAVNGNPMVNASSLENRKQSGLSVTMLYEGTYSRGDTGFFAHVMGNSRKTPGRCDLEPRDRTKLFHGPAHCSILSFLALFSCRLLGWLKGTPQPTYSFLPV